MKKIRSVVFTGIATAISIHSAFAAETYVSLGLGVAEEKVELNSLLPGFSTCSNSSVDFASSFSICRGQSPNESSGATFDLENSLAGAASVGFEWENWRLELEYAGREHGGQSRSQSALPLLEQFSGFSSGASGGIIGFPIGLPQENPKHEISRLNSQQLFVNAFYSFRTGVSWKPFVGLGIGVARIRYRYVLEGSELNFQIPEFPSDPTLVVDGPFIPRLFSFSNRTVLDAESSDNVLGYQLMAGIDRELSDRTTAFATLRWSRFEASEVTNLASGQTGPVGALSLSPIFTSVPENLDDIGGVSLVAGIRFSF